MARSRRKRCKVYAPVVTLSDNGRPLVSVTKRCEGKIKPGTPFCKEHFETHRLVGVKCTGENHPYGDHCGICAPFWGEYPIAVPKDQPLKKGQWEWEREWA